jgi:hypothetical protein
MRSSGIVRMYLQLSFRRNYEKKYPLLSTAQDYTFQALSAQPKAWEDRLRTKSCFEQSATQVRAAGRLGDLPLVVLTARQTTLGEDPRLRDLWENTLQAELARLSSRGRQILVDAGHAIPLLAPEAVISSVSEVVRSVRRGDSEARRFDRDQPGPR